MSYPNKNIGKYEDYDHVAMGEPGFDDDEPIKCTYARMAGGLMLHCGNYVIDWDGDEDPLCEEHSVEVLEQEKADLQAKAAKENDDG